MFTFIKRVRLVLGHLEESVCSNYGLGPFRYLKFMYYSLLRVNTFNVYEFFLNNKSIPLISRDDLEFVEVSLEKLDKYREKHFSQEFFMDSLGTLSKCHLVLCNGETAYIHWIYSSGEVSRFLKLGNGVAEINYIHTRPEFRRRGICHWAIGKGLEKLAEKGMKRVFAVVHTENVASCGVLECAGFTLVAKINSIGPFNRRMTL